MTTEIKPLLKGQEIIPIRKIQDFLKTTMTDEDIIVGVVQWYKSECNMKKFYEIYDGDVFKKGEVLEDTPIRVYLRTARTRDVRKLCKELFRATFFNLDLFDLDWTTLCRFFYHSVIKNTISTDMDVRIFKRMMHLANPLVNIQHAKSVITVNTKTSRCKFKIKDGRVIIYEIELLPRKKVKHEKHKDKRK